MPLVPLPESFPATVAALHRVAEEIVAPARKPDNEIALRATPGGFGTPEFDHDGAVQQVRVDGAELVHRVDGHERRTPLATLEDARRFVAALVPDGPLTTEPLDVDPEAAQRLGEWYAFGASVLAAFSGDPVRLWPEHFDIALVHGEANYGFSPGDEDHAEPYAYVGPFNPVEGDLWNASGFTGAELTYSELLAAPDPHAAALEFLTTRKEALA